MFLASLILLLAAASSARAQDFLLHAGAGPTLGDTGYDVTAGGGVTLGSRVTLLGSVERIHLARRRDFFPGGYSEFRGGTSTLGVGEVRVALFGRERVSPYGLAGLSAGRSRLNPNEETPDPETRDVIAPIVGGGLALPLGRRLSTVIEYRFVLIVGRETDDLYAAVPLRVGIAWRF